MEFPEDSEVSGSHRNAIKELKELKELKECEEYEEVEEVFLLC